MNDISPKNEWYTILGVERLDTPFIAMYPNKVKANIDALIDLVPDPTRLRPHIKTGKSAAVIALMLGAGITKFKCATIAEAEILALCKAPDVLLAYQPVGPKIDRLINLIKNYPDTSFSCVLDDELVAVDLSARAILANVSINVYLDLDVGMKRTGVNPEKALELYTSWSTIHGIKVVGLHAYDGQVADADLDVRNNECAAHYETVAMLVKAIVDTGHANPVVVMGSTPTLSFYAHKLDVECSPGTFIYWDAAYESLYKELPFETAGLVVTRVVSKPDERTLCLDLGYKAISSESELQQRVQFLNAEGLTVVSQSEEHMLVRTDSVHTFEIGDVLYGIPYHIGRTCNLYDASLNISNHHVSGEWHHSRERKIYF